MNVKKQRGVVIIAAVIRYFTLVRYDTIRYYTVINNVRKARLASGLFVSTSTATLNWRCHGFEGGGTISRTPTFCVSEGDMKQNIADFLLLQL